MNLIICGDSHVVALGDALAQTRFFARSHKVKVGKLFSFPRALSAPLHSEVGGRITFNHRKINREFIKINEQEHFDRANTYVLSCLFTTTILIRSSHWATHLPARSMRSGRQPVSDGVMAAIVLDHFRNGLALAQDLHAAGCTVMALESPPPRADDPSLGRYVTPLEALTIDTLAREIMLGKLADLGIDVVRCPEIARDPETGFLARDFYAERPSDYHHANAKIGGLFLENINLRLGE